MHGRFSPPAGGDLLCPWRLVVAMAQATFSWPFGPIHLESACLRFHLAAKTAPAPLFLLFPANPLRWASPGVTMDWAKRHRGRLRMSASRSYSPSLSPLAFGHLPLTRGVGPRSPITGVLSCLWRSPSGAQNQECLGTLSSGPPGPECAKFTSGAVQFLRLGFPTNAPGANPASPQTFPLGERWLAEGQTDEGAFPIKPSPSKGEGAPEGGG